MTSWEGGRVRRWAAAVAMASLMAVLASACGLPGPGSTSGGGSKANSERLTTAAGTKAAANAWVGHLVSYVAVDPTTIGKAETGFALQTDKNELAYQRSTGVPENRYQPTGKVDWVAIPSQAPTLFEVARIQTTFKPAPGSSASASSQDTLVLLQRKSIQAKWLISTWTEPQDSSEAALDQIRSVGNPLSSEAASKLPIPAQSLPRAYHDYVTGGNSAKFAPGHLTNQARSQFESSRASWAAAGASLTSPYSQGSIQGVYSLKGGDALVFFGVAFNNIYQASPKTCLQQTPSTPNFPPVVPDGKYQSVSFPVVESAMAIEDPHSGRVSMLALSLFNPVKGNTSPTTAPACL